MNRIDSEALLRRAAARAAGDRFFIGSALAVYQAEHGLDEASLAEWLGCERRQLARLALCRRPEPAAAAAKFRRDMEQIAAHTGAQPLRLAALLRAVDAVEALGAGAGSAAPLLAARDAEDQETGDRE